MAGLPENIVASKRSEEEWRNIMMKKFALYFNPEHVIYSVIWMSSPIANEAKVRFVKWLFPEPIMLAKLDDLQDAPVEKDKVVMIGPILSDIDAKVLKKLYRIHSIADKQKAKIIITSPRTILDSMISSLQVADFQILTHGYNEMLLSDKVLLTGGFDPPKNREMRMEILKDNLVKHFKDFKPIWLSCSRRYFIKGDFLEKVFPGDVEIITITKLTSDDNPFEEDKILMVDFRAAIKENVFAKLVSVADIAEQKKKRIIIFATNIIEDLIYSLFPVEMLTELKGRFREELVDEDLILEA